MGGASSLSREHHVDIDTGQALHQVRRQQESLDSIIARRIALQELVSEGRIPTGAMNGRLSQASRRSGASSQELTIQAKCSSCNAMNQFTTSSSSTLSRVKVRCGACSEEFQAQIPSSSQTEGPTARLTTLRLCRRCGMLNQFTLTEQERLNASMQCGNCGHVVEASDRQRGASSSSSPRRSLEQLMQDPRFTRGPMVRIPINGQQRALPLALLLVIMANERRAANTRHNGADSSDVAALPTRKLDSLDHLGEQTKCLVCLDEFADGDDLKTMPCLHFYHQRCLEQWLSTNNSCPVCKTPVGQ